MAIESSTVTMPSGPLVGGAFPPNQVVSGYITIVNGAGTAAVIDHVEFVTVSASAAKVAGPITFSVVPPAIGVASGATIVVPFSCVAQSPQTQSLVTQEASAAAARSYSIQPVIYTTDGQVVLDDGNGNPSLSILPITWNTGGGG